MEQLTRDDVLKFLEDVAGFSYHHWWLHKQLFPLLSLGFAVKFFVYFSLTLRPRRTR